MKEVLVNEFELYIIIIMIVGSGILILFIIVLLLLIIISLYVEKHREFGMYLFPF